MSAMLVRPQYVNTKNNLLTCLIIPIDIQCFMSMSLIMIVKKNNKWGNPYTIKPLI